MALTMGNIKRGGGYEPLPVGKHDGVLHAIIGLEVQKQVFKGQEKIAPQVLFLFEIPAELRPGKDGEELPAIVSLQMSISPHPKSKFYNTINALLRANLDEEEVFELIQNDAAIKDLLGKTGVVQIKEYVNGKGETKNCVEQILELDKRLPQPKGVREPFYFTAANPDIDKFKNTIISWTRDKIMSAVNADEYPAELHQAYKEIKEQEAANSNNKMV